MEPFKRILITLEGSERDAILIQNIALMSRFMAIQEIHFIHVINRPKIPVLIKEKYPEIQKTDNKEIKDSMISRVSINFPDIDKYDHDFIVEEGEHAEVIVAFIKENDIDFLVIGRNPSPGITYQTRKIGHLAPCAIGLFPLIIKEKFRKIVVPIDYSVESITGLNRAYFYSDNDPEIDVLPVHFYNVPLGYYRIGKTFEEFASIMKANAKTRLESILQKIDNKTIVPSYDILLDEDDDVTDKIFDYTLKNGADLLIMGSRGRTQFASFMMGSVAVKLMEIIYHIPILIEKDKKRMLGLVDVMLQ